MKTLSLAVRTLLVGGALFLLPDARPESAPAAPFWQLHGAVPTARDPAAVADLRLAVRASETEPLALAAR
jgi:hypothetical protein